MKTMRKASRSTTELVRFGKDDSQTDELSVAVVNRRVGIGEILAERAMAWCRCWLQNFPIKMTLNNVGLLTVFLAIVSPRSLIYRLVYPIFRLVFGTLYPAYASYKAVRTKNVKEYVSERHTQLPSWFHQFDSGDVFNIFFIRYINGGVREFGSWLNRNLTLHSPICALSYRWSELYLCYI